MSEYRIVPENIKGMTYHQELEVGIVALAGIKAEYPEIEYLEPSATADEIVHRTGIDWESAALVSFQ